MNFLDLAEEYRKEDSMFAVLPVEYEKDVTYGAGASKGPSEIIKASKHLEYYDEQFDIEPFEKGIITLEPVKAESPEEMIEKVSDSVPSKFTITLGGDHAVTIGAVKGFEKNNDDFSVVVLDAHSDFRYSWNNSRLNHACVSRNLVGKHKVLAVGVRSMDVDEAKEINENENMEIIKSYDFTEDRLKEKLQNLSGKVYVSIDADVFDPAFIRNTGTPEPGGFNWDRVIGILKIIFEQKNVIGADIVEFAPKENFDAEAFSLAKLAYKIMALKERFK